VVEMVNFDNRAADINNGFFRIQKKSDGIYLAVYPPVNNGVPIQLDEVLNKINEKNIKNFNYDLLQKTVEESSGLPVKISEPQFDALDLDDVIVNVNVTPDKMKAYILIEANASSKFPTVEELERILNSNGVIFGIKRDILENLAKGRFNNESVCVAEGTQPINGTNGKVDFKFDINKEMHPTILEDGRVDYRELNIIQNVKKGDILCTLVPPTPGIPGKNVAGEEVPAKDGKPAIMPKGRNVEFTEDKLALRSMIDGQIIYENNKVSVYANLEINTDVDNSTGNINFVGNVLVRGNVLSGFTIEADGYVEVWGVVEGATIKSKGNIILRRGMRGNGKGVLISGGDIVAKYIEYSTVEAKNNITADAIMHSNVKCGNKLELSGSNGLLLGGICRVGNEVVAKVIGSHMAVATEVEVGIDPVQKERYRNLKKEVEDMTKDIKKAEQAIAILQKLEKAGMLSPEKREMMARSKRTQDYYANKIQEAREEIEMIEQQLLKDAQGKIHVRNFAYPGVKISIGNISMYVRDVFEYCTFYKDGADIKTTPLAKTW